MSAFAVFLTDKYVVLSVTVYHGFKNKPLQISDRYLQIL